ncbi:MAG: hypothetical protein ACOYIB_02135, partial [Desulfosporosinus sp.]
NLYLQYLEDHNINWRLSTNGRLLQKIEIRDMLLNFKGLLVISMENGAKLVDVNLLIQEKAQKGSQLKILLQTFGDTKGDTTINGVIPGDYQICHVDQHSWGNKGLGEYQECCFLNQNWTCVLWDGTIVSCCFDMEGEGKLGHVSKPGTIRNRPWRLCPTCEVVLRC